MKKRHIQTSVNNFIHCGDEYLFLLRSKDKKIDAGRLNSIGGKVEPGENYLDAVIRETEEESGIIIKPKDIKLIGIVRLEGGYEDDWLMCFFKTEISSKNLPIGNRTKDGQLLWIKKENVLNGNYEVVDDLHYSFEDIVNNKGIFFACAQIDEKEKVKKYNMNKIPE